MPFIKIMGKKDNKKKVKKANVKEFPVDSALEQEKKNLNSKRTAYAIYTVFCFIIVITRMNIPSAMGAHAATTMT